MISVTRVIPAGPAFLHCDVSYYRTNPCTAQTHIEKSCSFIMCYTSWSACFPVQEWFLPVAMYWTQSLESILANYAHVTLECKVLNMDNMSNVLIRTEEPQFVFPKELRFRGDFGKHSINFEKNMQGDELPMFNENVFVIWLQKVSSNARLLFIISV